jgi:hypothetical protein
MESMAGSAIAFSLMSKPFKTLTEFPHPRSTLHDATGRACVIELRWLKYELHDGRDIWIIANKDRWIPMDRLRPISV